MLFTSVVLVCAEQTETSVASSIDDPSDFASTAALGGVYTVDSTVNLPALSAGESYTFDGSNGTAGNFVLTNAVSDVTFENLISITEGNEGTYIFQNMTIDASTYNAIWIGSGTGSVQFNNVTFTGDSSLKIDTYSNTIINSCTFNAGLSLTAPLIFAEDGELTLTNSQLFCGNSYAGLETHTNDPITVDNCYFETTNGVAVLCESYGGAIDLSVSNCTFIGAFNPDGLEGTEIDVLLDGGSSGNSIAITNSYFTCNNFYSTQAINVSGYGTGTMTIADCCFKDFDSEGGQSVVSLDSLMTFSITGTTFFDLATGFDYLFNGGSGGGPILRITGMTGQITNSTFYNNETNADFPVGCVLIEDGSQVDMVYDTFCDNSYMNSSFDSAPASLDIEGSTVNLINCIMDPQEDGTSAIIGDSPALVQGCILSGNIEEIFVTWDGVRMIPGPLTGCDLSGIFGIDTIETIMSAPALMILPGGPADGKGVTQSELSGALLSGTVWPTTDQTGAVRLDDISDIGSVTNQALTVTFVNGTQVTSVPVIDGVVSRPADPVLNGYDFMGWYTAQTGGALWNFDTQILESMTLYARWAEITPSSFTVTFDPRNGDDTFSVTVGAGQVLTEPEAPTLEGSTFNGWFTASDGGTEWDFSTPVTANLTLFAQWTSGQTFVVTFDPRNGDDTFTVTVEAGQVLTLPQEPTLEGDTFSGWFTASNGGTQWNFNSPVTGDMTLYAQWGSSGGSQDDSGFTSTDGASVVAIVVASVIASLGILPVAFAGAGAAKLSGVSLSSQSMSNHARVDSTGEDNIVTFDPRNGRSPWATTVSTGNLLGMPGNPRARGKTFSHWSETPDGPPFDFKRPVASVVHLFAVYIEGGNGKA